MLACKPERIEAAQRGKVAMITKAQYLPRNAVM
jgi:hypothetical protein